MYSMLRRLIVVRFTLLRSFPLLGKLVARAAGSASLAVGFARSDLRNLQIWQRVRGLVTNGLSAAREVI